MRLFNKELTVGKAYCKYFPGATPGEIAHYCLPTLQKDKADAVIINVGTNSLPNDETCDISNEIIDLLKICRNNGVKEVLVSSITFQWCKDVLVSGITFRYHHQTKVSDLNNLLESKKHIYNFTFISNENILAKDIGKDNLHLNYAGTVKIATNIIDAINTLHS